MFEHWLHDFPFELRRKRSHLSWAGFPCPERVIGCSAFHVSVAGPPFIFAFYFST